ncbi:MAG: hypothetical protein P4L67_04115 [Candidatus Pacebacteria bacterium]|nr:hypothetical protein [Candidatus Paceibacterota bacterium]
MSNPEKELTKEELDAFLAEYAAKPKTEEDETPLMRNARLDREERAQRPELWEDTLRKSKTKAREMAGLVPSLEASFEKSHNVMLSVKAHNDGEAFDVSTSRGEVDHEALNALRSFLDDCTEIRVPNGSFGDDTDCIRFAGLFAGPDEHRLSPEELFKTIKDALAGAEDVR